MNQSEFLLYRLFRLITVSCYYDQNLNLYFDIKQAKWKDSLYSSIFLNNCCKYITFPLNFFTYTSKVGKAVIILNRF